ncbi:MAG: hydrolase [Methylovulum sp.]|uniref:hydrolase n=1 Tax=Methylovulum sp. TaxID=1916980 RepID=UPI00260EE215|nr:hydrolase [Methylovulum sp.]MDD2724887.1 hydrolase [Methylovulum sp.]MDD5124711.1 hydrolase [Methylovulum sp.]
MLNKTPFKPAWWLRNRHFQTLYPALLRRTPKVPHLWRERISTPDGDFLDLDHCGTGAGPRVILLHGLTGSSGSGYIKGLQVEFLRRGWRSVVMNFRGCSGESNNKARCYHSGETEDIQFVYESLRQREPGTQCAAVGFSLGGNVLLKWLGEQGGRVDLAAAVAVSVPLVLNLCASKLDNGFSKIYRANLLKRLKTYMRLKQAHLERNGHQAEAEKIRRLGDCSKISSFWQYDDVVVAGLHGFKDVHDYYQRSSSRQFLKHITVPTLVIQADDDPFMTSAVLPAVDELSAHVQLEVTCGGGHVGFVARQKFFKPYYWLEQRIPEFLGHYL